MTADLTSALEAWRQALGPDHVEDNEAARERTDRATFATPYSDVLAVLRPASIEQVQDCVKVANRFSVPLYPISRGRNWGYGSMSPAGGDCAVVDLSRLNRISDYDEKLGAVTVEPGVTQEMLSRFLAENGDRFWIDATGSTPAASMLGNALERRRGDLAILRCLGAPPRWILGQLLLEALILTGAGVLLGLLIGHGAVELLGGALPQDRDLGLTGALFLWEELWLALGALVLGALAALPAGWRAYRSDVSRVLSTG